MFFGLLASVYSPRAAAANYPAWADAWAACQSSQAAWTAQNPMPPGNYWAECHTMASPAKLVLLQYRAVSTGWGTLASFNYDGPVPPANPCTAAYTPQRIYNEGKITQGASICGRATDAFSGGTVQCALTFTPISPPTQNQNSGGWETYGTLAPSGNVCGGTEGDPWKDGNGGAMNPAPPVPTLPATDVPAPPQICGGGSCYDAKNDKYCASSGGAQFCVSGATARSAAGGCVSSGDATICAGSPNAPKPPAPPASPITDPPTQIKAQDNTTQADKVTGTPQNVSTTVYAQPSAPVDSGQKPGDKGPPAKDPAEPEKASASGGQDCNTPPICTGDAPTCMVVSQVWLDRCKGDPDWTKIKPGDGDQYATGETSAGEVMSTETVDASKIDQTSWAGNSCPQLPTVMVFGKPWSMDQGYFCESLDVFRNIFIFVCGFIAVCIVAVGGKR